ncbi:MAG: sulfotransferase [Myxococcales bacterium]|nr:sulfotransferase [Myxococcales bacterium]MDH3485129.1 sulfotransferase [Myxococcales bacterium]
MTHSSRGPIFIGGSGRCGTTVLANTLGRHPGIFTFPDELRMLTAGSENLIDWMHSPQNLHLKAALRQNLRGGFFSRASLSELVRSPRGASFGALYRKLQLGSYFSRPVARNDEEVGLCRSVDRHHYQRAVDEFLATFPGGSIQERRNQIQEFIDACAEDPLRRVGAARWCDGTPDNVFHMLDLADIFPGAKFVHIIREGRGVARSFYRLGWSPSTTAALRRWHHAVAVGRALGEELGPEQYLEVSFETLLADAERTLRTIVTFVGEDWRAELEQHEITRAAVTPSGDDLDDDLDRLFAALASDLANDFGWT